MTKKDYIIIARILKALFNAYYEAKNLQDIERALSQYEANLIAELKNDNPLFNENKFRKAIGRK